MKRLLASVLAAGILVLAPLFVKGQGKSEAPIPATEEDYKQLAKVDELVGKLGSAVGKSVTLIIEFKSVSLDPAKVAAAASQSSSYRPQPPSLSQQYSAMQSQQQHQQRMSQLQQQYVQAMQTQDPQQRQQRLNSWMQAMQRYQMDTMRAQAQQYQQQMVQAMERQQQQLVQAAQNKNNNNGPYKVASTAKEYEFNIREDAIIRRMNLPFTYDDKGNVKQYSPEELQKLKGKNPKLPGYEAKMEDLEAGQMVKLYIAAPKEGKIGGVDLVGNVIKPEVRVLVVYGDYDQLNNPGAKKQ